MPRRAWRSGLAAIAARLVLGLVDAEAASIEIRSVEGADGLSGRVFLLHLDEGEAACAAGLAVHDHVDRSHVTMACEEGPEVALRGREGKVSDIDFLAQTISSSGPLLQSADRPCSPVQIIWVRERNGDEALRYTSQRAVPECDLFFRLGDRGAWFGRVL